MVSKNNAGYIYCNYTYKCLKCLKSKKLHTLLDNPLTLMYAKNRLARHFPI